MKKKSLKTLKTTVVLIVFGFVFTACSGPEPRKPVVRKTGTFVKESIKRNKVLKEVEEAAILTAIKKDSIGDINVSPLGFWYYYNKRSDTQTALPVKGDEVVFTYEVYDLNGNVIYNKSETGEKHYLIDKEDIIPGLADGLKLMHPGEEVTFYFPSFKAFGYTGNERVDPNQPLVYRVELLRIIEKTNN